MFSLRDSRSRSPESRKVLSKAGKSLRCSRAQNSRRLKKIFLGRFVSFDKVHQACNEKMISDMSDKLESLRRDEAADLAHQITGKILKFNAAQEADRRKRELFPGLKNRT